jgi:hypothetical protein
MLTAKPRARWEGSAAVFPDRCHVSVTLGERVLPV